MRVIAALLIAALCIALHRPAPICADVSAVAFDGVYADASGVTRVRFAADGKVFWRIGEAERQLHFQATADEVHIYGDVGTVSLKRSRPGQLVGPMGLVFLRQLQKEA